MISNIVADQGVSASQATPPNANQVIPTPLNPEQGLPSPHQITNDGINHWICSVRDAYAGGRAGTLADSCTAMSNNAQLLCMGTMDMMTSGLETYKTDLISCKSELVSLKHNSDLITSEYARHMSSCNTRKEKLETDKQALQR